MSLHRYSTAPFWRQQRSYLTSKIFSICSFIYIWLRSMVVTAFWHHTPEHYRFRHWGSGYICQNNIFVFLFWFFSIHSQHVSTLCLEVYKVKRPENVPNALSIITPREGICLCITVSTLDWTAHWVFVSMSWENMHIISNLHEFCRLHPLIQKPTFSSMCNIAFLAGNQNCNCPDLTWTDKTCVCIF